MKEAGTKEPRQRLSSEVVKRGYSDEEVAHIYELARFSLENGETRRAETIVSGLVEIAPEFIGGWLCLALIHLQNHAYDAAILAGKQALKLNAESTTAQLYLVASYLCTGDFNSAGTLLGEIGEDIESGRVDDPNMVRFYQAQMARFQNR